MAIAPDSTRPQNLPEQMVLPLSPLVRLTLLLLYISLTVPLPFLSQATHAPIAPTWLWIGLVVGLILLYAALSEKVIVNAQGIQVAYPQWVPSLFRKGWSLAWSEITALKPRSTGQGGLVYYFVSKTGQAYLLPMRVAGFTKLVQFVQTKTQIHTVDVRPLSQPWMYIILLGFTILLSLVDIWAIAASTHLGV